MDCARNIITANFSGGGTSATTAPLWQWDYGQALCITGIDLPAAFEVHFSTNKTGGVSTVAVGADGQVTIPNELLTIGKNLNAWIYLSDAQGEGETEYSILIPVKARPMPETYDAEATGEFDDVVRQVSEYAETAQTAADNAGASASAAATSASEAAASASAAETAKTAAETAQGKVEDAQAAAETAAQTATERAQQTAQDAAQAASDAGRAESAAGRAEAAQTGAESAKTGAETAAQGAAASASAASASSTSAGQAAASAAQSAAAAAQSAASIEGDVQIASQKAAEAQTAAGQAITAKEAAQTAQTGAKAAATNAGQSASTATTKASEAAQSASNAAQSKTDAEAAATRAETAAASLTVDSALSDSSVNPVQNKVVTESVTRLKSAIDIFDFTAYADHSTRTSDGITYEYVGDNTWNVRGTIDGISVYVLFASATSVAPFVAGGKYLVRFYTPSPNVYLQCYKYAGATWTNFKEIYSSDGNVELVVPSDATGIRIRFRTNASVDTTCTLRIYEDTPVIRDIDTLKTGVSANASDISKLLMGAKYAPLNVLALDGTYNNALNANGVVYTFSNMVCTANGTSTGISAVNIYNNTSKLPIFIEAGKTYNVKYAPSSNKLTVEFRYYASGDASSTWIKTVTGDTTVTIPANAVGMQIRYRVQNGNTVTNDTGCVAMLTDYTVSELSAAVDALRENSEKNLQYAEDMAFTAPISYEVIGNSSKWSIGTAISPANGVLISDAKYCCTGYVAFDDPTLLYFNSDDYDFIVWEYSDASISNATFTPKSEYSGNYAVVTPAQSSTYFRISVRRKDNANMSSSDVTALITTAKCFTLTDKSMTLANAAADAKVSGGLFSSIKNQIMENNSYDVIRNLNGTSGESRGITFTYNNNHTCTVFGTATEATFSNLYANNAALPENVIAGKTYFVKYKSNRVRLRLMKYVNGGEPVKFFETLKDAYVTIPANATGLIIRLHVANQAVVDETIEMPRLMTTPTNDDLFNVALNTNSVDVSKIMFGENSETNGVAFVYNGNGTVSVTGTATGPAFNNLYYNANALPTGIEAGKTYRIKYSSKKVFLRIYAYINGSDTKICDTLRDTKITIPEGTEGLIIRLQVLTGITVSETFAFPVILTAFSNRELTDIVQGYASEPMLTIIDDDGDVHFKYDLLPLIAELNVPIASAVTPTRIAASEAADPGAYNTRWMTWAQIQECAEGGAEITCHMYSHPTPEQIESMTLDEIAHRLFMAKNYMKVHGVDSNVLVYSFGTGATGQKLHKAAERVFDCGFSNTSNATPIRSDYDRYDLPRYVIDGNNNYNVENMKDIIDDVVANGGWAVWMIHTSSGSEWRNILDGEGHDTGVADTDGTGNYVGKVKSVPALREAIEYALNLGVKIVTAEYGLKKYFAEAGRMN